MAIKEKFKNTFRSKFNNFGRPATVDEAPIVSRIVISAYD